MYCIRLTTWRSLDFIGRVRYPRFSRNVLAPGVFAVAFELVHCDRPKPFMIKVADE